MATRGGEWTFEDFCLVYCSASIALGALAQRLGRTEGAIDAVRASITAVESGSISPTFPGRKWEEFVRRAQAGECKCGQTR